MMTVFRIAVEDMQHVQQVLILLKKAYVTPNFKKCGSFINCIDYLSYVLHPGIRGVDMDDRGSVKTAPRNPTV